MRPATIGGSFTTPPPRETVPITGVWLRREGDYVLVCVEVDRKWVQVIKEHHDGSFSHICEPAGIRARALVPADSEGRPT